MKKTVLIVDDDGDIKKIIRVALENEGYNIIDANNADDCIKKLSKTKVDLILIDIMMPGTPVKDVVPKIKGPKIAYVTVVQTSEAEREFLLKQKNVVGFIQKPFQIGDLVNSVNQILAK